MSNEEKKEARENEKIRNRVEGKFGEGKRRYGLNKIMTKLLNLSASYDSHYLALAQSLNCQFYTGDKRLYNSVKNQINWINLII